MRHGNKGRKLKRTASHRAATLNALATSLITHKRIRTTVAKAKETRIFVEPIITRAKNALALKGDEMTIAAGMVHARREVARQIKDPAAVKILFADIAPRVEGRPGGYTRVVKLGQRHGDNAHIAILELVDWNGAEGNVAPAVADKVAKPRPTRNKAKAAEAVAATAEAPKKPRATRKKKEAEAAA